MVPEGAEPYHVRHLVEDGAFQVAVGLEAVQVAAVEEHHAHDRQRVVRADLTGSGAAEDASRSVDLPDLDVDQQVVDHAVAGDLSGDVVLCQAVLERGLADRAPVEVAPDRGLPELFRALEGAALGVGEQRRADVHDLDVVDGLGRRRGEGRGGRRGVPGGRRQPVGRAGGGAEDPLADRREAERIGPGLGGGDFAVAARGERHDDVAHAVSEAVGDLDARRDRNRELRLGRLAVPLHQHDLPHRSGQSDGLEGQWIAGHALGVDARHQRVGPRLRPQRPAPGSRAALRVGGRLGAADGGVTLRREEDDDVRERPPPGVGDDHLGGYGNRCPGRGLLVRPRDRRDLGRDAQRGGAKDHRIEPGDARAQFLRTGRAHRPPARRRDPVGVGDGGGRRHRTAARRNLEGDRHAAQPGAGLRRHPHPHGLGGCCAGPGGLSVAGVDYQRGGRVGCDLVIPSARRQEDGGAGSD